MNRLKRMISDDGDYVKVYLNCPIRHGWIIVAQISKDEWNNPEYDKYRREDIRS